MWRDMMMRSFSSDTMTLRTVLVLAVLHFSIGVSNFPPMIYDNYLQSDGNAVEYPNPEAKVWNVLTPNSVNSDYMFSEDLITSEAEIPEEMLDTDHVVLQKRPNAKPIGRKKRSLSEEDTKVGQSDLQEDAMKKDWTSDTDQDYFVTADKRKPKNKVVFIPRIGKKRSSDFGEVEEKRAIFIPRIGKKSVSDLSEDEAKRAIFIPRIGKKSNSGLGETEEKRAVFIPRIGKKSASVFGEMAEKRAIFIPRIGRGALIPQMTRYNLPYRVSTRAIFIPRIG